VREARHRPRLAQQALAVHRLVDHLDRDAPIELGVVGRVDLAHLAGAEMARDDVAIDPRADRQRHRR
jgi:hypothetical protein